MTRQRRGGGSHLVRVRADQADLAAEVAAVVEAKEIRRARGTIKNTQKRMIRTTFCPVCGGNKRLASFVCYKCRDELNKRHVRLARKAGVTGRVSGVAGAHRAYIRENLDAVRPSHGDQHHGEWRSSRKVHTEGSKRVQPWSRKVLHLGVWVEESSLLPPENDPPHP